MEGKEIYDSLVHAEDLCVAVEALSNDGLVEVLRYLRELPNSGVPLMVGAAVDEVVERRFIELHEAMESKE